MSLNWFLTRRIDGILVKGSVTDEEAARVRVCLFKEGVVGSMHRRSDGGWTISTPADGAMELTPLVPTPIFMTGNVSPTGSVSVV